MRVLSRGEKMQIEALLKGRKGLEKLLNLEKQRRGVDRDSLVFIGMADVAGYYWCAMKSLYKNREMELEFFASYLYDRISYSLQLGLIKKLPQSPGEILRVGDEIGFNDVEQLLREKAERESQLVSIIEAERIVDEHGNQFLVINPALPLEVIESYKQWAEDRGIRVVSLDEAPPRVRGEIIESVKAERYPTIRWNFAWDKYVVVGVPDGITNEFVYEFKSTKSRFLMNFLRPVALTQADLYGYFFRRNKKRVQIYIVETGETVTWDAPVDIAEAKTVLNKFKEVEMGLTPPLPKAWKCKSCEFAKLCTLKAG